MFFLLSKKKNFLLDLFYCDKVGFSVLREVLFLGLGRYIKSCRDGVEAPFVDSLNQKWVVLAVCHFPSMLCDDE